MKRVGPSARDWFLIALAWVLEIAVWLWTRPDDRLSIWPFAFALQGAITALYLWGTWRSFRG